MVSPYRRLPVKLPKQRSRTTPHVIDALSDKASSVRRHAIATLTSMILTHPFGAMYGGFLNLDEWEARYRAVKQSLKALNEKQIPEAAAATEPEAPTDKTEDEEEAENVEEEEKDEGEGEDQTEEVDPDDPDAESPKKKKKSSSKSKKPRASSLPPPQQELSPDDLAQITRLKLTKKYIADALEFIRQVEGSMDVLGQLLGSASKAEVLEAIEFWKVAYEYQMTGASVSSSM